MNNQELYLINFEFRAERFKKPELEGTVITLFNPLGDLETVYRSIDRSVTQLLPKPYQRNSLLLSWEGSVKYVKAGDNFVNFKTQ